MKEPRWIPTDVVLALHDMQLAAFGGPMGIRDEGLLESALARPRQRFAYARPKPSLARLAAACAFGIVRNHPFLDGNKRTGLIVAFVLLELNRRSVDASEEETFDIFMRLAAGKLSEDALSEWLGAHSSH
jgi:death on curing protein